MRRSTIGWQLISALAFSAPVTPLRAQDTPTAVAASERWTDEELDNLLAPIALYPDPILAQVLVAATYPDQVLAAQAHVKAFGSDRVDQMPWEISVKAVARYEPVLNLLAEGEDWMTALGQAYVTQPNDVMDAVQRLRRMANAQGNLQTTAQQQVVVEREVIRIVPAEPRFIYVPTYDPAVIYHRPIYIAHAHPAYWSWSVAYPIGVWLTYDFDWHAHRVFHHGWHVHGPHWVVVARPFIVINPIYVGPRHTVVVVNRNVVHRRWDTQVVRRYSVVHRGTTFDRHDRGFRRDPRDNRGRAVATNNGSRGANATPVSGRGTARSASGNRVVPLPSGGNPRGSTPRANTPRRDVTPTATTPRATPRGNATESTRSSNGTWNPRPERTRATPAPGASAPNTSASRTSAPRPERGNTPQASQPRTNSGSAPRASAPRTGSGTAAPRATTPNAKGGTAAPRSGTGTPRASAPRSNSGGGSARGGSSSSGRSGNGGGGSSKGRGGRG